MHIGPNLLRTGPGLSRMAQIAQNRGIWGLGHGSGPWPGPGPGLDHGWAWTMAGPVHVHGWDHGWASTCTWLVDRWSTSHVHGWWTNGWWTVGPPLVHICVSIGPGKPFDLRERVFGPLNLPEPVDPVDELRPFKANALAIFVTFYAIFVRSV